MNNGVDIVLARMETHPEEFYGDNDKWKFIYKEYFRDAMSETEKGAIFDRMKQIRKEEFTQAVMRTMLADTMKQREEDWDEKKAGYMPTPHNKKKPISLNAIQLKMAKELSRDNGMSMIQAAQKLGYL